MDVVFSDIRRPQFGTNFQTIFCNAPSVMSFRKQIKTHYFEILSRPPDGCAMFSPDIG